MGRNLDLSLEVHLVDWNNWMAGPFPALPFLSQKKGDVHKIISFSLDALLVVGAGARPK